MNTGGKNWGLAVGRVLISLLFLLDAFGKITKWNQTAGFMASKHMPMVPFFLAGAIVLQIVGGLMVLTGWQAKYGAVALIIFLVPATLIFHNFWASTGADQQMQLVQFLKNLSILGGLTVVASPLFGHSNPSPEKA